jgi:hypothetical protein
LFPRHAGDIDALEASDPVKLRHIELHFLLPDQLRQDQGRIQDGHRRAVFGSHVVEIVGCNRASAARHILHGDAGVAGDMGADPHADKPGQAIKGAAGRVGDDYSNRLPGKRILLLSGICSRRLGHYP